MGVISDEKFLSSKKKKKSTLADKHFGTPSETVSAHTHTAYSKKNNAVVSGKWNFGVFEDKNSSI